MESKLLIFFFLIPSNKKYVPFFTVTMSSNTEKLQQYSLSVSLSPLKCYKNIFFKR